MALISTSSDSDNKIRFNQRKSREFLEVLHRNSINVWILYHPSLQLFEGMKAYRGVDGRIRVFRPNMNMNRMNLTAYRSGLPTFEGEQMIQCMNRLISIDQEWVPHTNAASLYIRPTMIGIDVSIKTHERKARNWLTFEHLTAHTRSCLFRLSITLRHP